jgi:hypothetical protein
MSTSTEPSSRGRDVAPVSWDSFSTSWSRLSDSSLTGSSACWATMIRWFSSAIALAVWFTSVTAVSSCWRVESHSDASPSCLFANVSAMVRARESSWVRAAASPGRLAMSCQPDQRSASWLCSPVSLGSPMTCSTRP